MATRFPQINPTNIALDTFARVEQKIRTYFDTIISAVTIRRDELIQQLNDLKRDYLSKEDLRKKQIQGLEQMIGQLDDMSDHQSSNLKFHEENIKRTREELKKAEQPTPVPVPHFNSDLQSLLQQLERIGTVYEFSSLYSYKLEPVRSIGKKGNKKGEFNLLHGVRVDGKIYVCDTNNSRVQVFSNDGKFLTEFGKGQLFDPNDIALCDKWAFVSDCGLPNTVFKFRISNFKLINNCVEGVLNGSRGLTVDNNEVLVADWSNNRIAVLNLDLHYLREIGKGMLNAPCDVKTDSSKIFVTDENSSHNVHVFSKSADLLYSMISVSSRTYADKFLCLDQFSNIIISNQYDKSIQIFTSEGQLIHSIQCGGYPMGIAVTNNNTIVCVVDDSVKFY